MSRTYEQLEPVIMALDGRINAKSVQIATNTDDIAQLKNTLSDVKEDLNATIAGVSCRFPFEGRISTEGNYVDASNYMVTDYLEVGQNSYFSLCDFFAGQSTNAYSFYDENKQYISGQNNVSGNIFVDTIPTTAKYVRFSSSNESWRNIEPSAVLNNIDLFFKKTTPIDTTFFEGFNIMKIGNPIFRSDRFVNQSGMYAGSNTWTVVIEIEPNSDYYFMIPDRNRQAALVSPNNLFVDQTGYTYKTPILYTKYNGNNIYRVSSEDDSHYLAFYFYSGEYDIATNRDGILIIKDSWIANPIIHIRNDNTIRHYGTFSILGDSYSTFEDYLTPQNAGHWYPTTLENNVTEIEQTWWYKFANQYGCSLKENVSWNGSTISYDGHGDGTADGKTISFIERMSNITNPELILVYGGTNDSWVASKTGRADFLGDYKYSGFTESDFEYFRPSVAYVLTELRKKHVGSHIVFMLNSNLINIRESVQTICEHLNIPLCEMYALDLTNAHPNQTGMQQIADYITDFLNVGN